MIEIIGHSGTSEYEAAVSIAEALKGMWPEVEASPARREHIIISVGVKISGYPVSDIDIVIAGVFCEARTFVPTRVLKDGNGKKCIKQPVTVRDFVAVIEVKDHDQRGIQIVGDTIEVYYSRSGWHNATEQNVKQMHSLRYYFRDKRVDGPFVHRALLMRGLSQIDMPGVLPRSFTGEEFLSALASLSIIQSGIDGFRFSSGNQQDVARMLSLPIFRAIVPSGLDRKRMDLILKETPLTQKLVETLGKKMVRLRGQGGTGKTVMLLQAAWRKFSERGERTLILTYNKALAADIRRLLNLLGVPSNPGDGGIAVDTVMSFMYSWFKRLQLLDEEDGTPFDDYPLHCAAARDLLEAGAISESDLRKIFSQFPEKYDFDYVMVDESQDWPQAEADLLKSLYTPNRITIGDGVDQLVRGGRTDWDRGIRENDREIISLKISLRMKSNLSGLVQSISKELGFPWEPQPSDKSGGGHLYLVSGSIVGQLDLVRKLTESAKVLGNAEIDFLFCVPPSSVFLDGVSRKSDVGIELGKAGEEVWDGVDPESRNDFPASKKQYRIVQYDSCRGLEGWTVILDRLDEAWCYFRNQRFHEGLNEQDRESFHNLDDVSSVYAWQRIFIALCRPIDTLVITIADSESECAKVIRKIAMQKDGFVTYL